MALSFVAGIITKHNPKAVVNAEVISEDTKGMIKEAEKLKRLHKNVVVKIPMTVEGLKAVKALSKQSVKTNVTLCFSPNQALLAAKAGATYVSPFVGRLDDIGHYGMQLVEEILDIYDNYGFETQVIVASVRSPRHVKESALLGADICTVPYAIFEKLYFHSLTDKGLKQFLDDWKKYKK